MKRAIRLFSFFVLLSLVLGPVSLVNPPGALALTGSSSQSSPTSYSWTDWIASYALQTKASSPTSATSTTTSTSATSNNQTQTTPSNSTSQPLASEEQWMLTQINRERTSRGIKPLTLDPALVNLARKKSQDMVVNNYFAHESPTYGSPGKMVKDAGIKYWLCGENLARAATVATAHQLLMESSIHRANILNQRYTHIGIGIVPQKSGRGVMVTQLFIAK
ncbi:CAP domain-containing protein [Syntrophothermus lipocalidus]|uniref:SCP-like extracellular protein n=1 Tax=Syntrophothermus lipocalidus (strain DSM 12680 / TGB-C1) TaxID=643648 RepID=D7CIK6_SYNLT|nr:CAP domain-containing protein [Syntrophothermus lipocalidus]ADI00871.1 SCP-like extracellular protein [Syntrophothermus lipocalidus DSM 12680]